jgi:uncharacterized protein (TIGR03066 family)
MARPLSGRGRVALSDRPPIIAPWRRHLHPFFSGERELQMRILGCALTVCVVCVMSGGCKGKSSSSSSSSSARGSSSSSSSQSEKQQISADKLIGTWELVKAEGEKQPPAGTTAEYTKDNKVIVAGKAGGKEFKIEAKYKVEGDKLTTTIDIKGKTQTEVDTIQTLNDTTLILRDKEGKLAEFKKQ